MQVFFGVVTTLCLVSPFVESFSAMPKAMPKYNDGTEYAMKYTDINNILKQNREYVASMGQEFFDDLGSKHQPKYMWIGCADARAPANEIMGEKPGSVFVMRNVANMVVNTDVSMLGALQFAVTVLGVKQIIVCGHYDCGGVRASMKKADVGPPLEMWVRNLRDVYRTHQKELDAIVDPEQRHRRMVEINVVEQCVNLYKTGIIQKQRIETSKDPNCNFSAPVIHACVFDPKNGLLKQLDISFDDYLAEFREVYEMYGSIVTDSTPHPPKAPDVPTMATEKLSEKKLSAKKLSAENLFVEKLLNEAEEKLSEEKLAADKLSAVKKYFIMEANPLSGDLVGGIKSL